MHRRSCGSSTAAALQIAIDDFGTGYSSLSRLREMPVSVLKIDRSFVTDVESDPQSASIVTAFLELARGLDMTTLAEGIETEEEFAFLQERGCQLGQGYLFSQAGAAGGDHRPRLRWRADPQARRRRRGSVGPSSASGEPVSHRRGDRRRVDPRPCPQLLWRARARHVGDRELDDATVHRPGSRERVEDGVADAPFDPVVLGDDDQARVVEGSAHGGDVDRLHAVARRARER